LIAATGCSLNCSCLLPATIATRVNFGLAFPFAKVQSSLGGASLTQATMSFDT
jgi:hypothetical protein